MVKLTNNNLARKLLRRERHGIAIDVFWKIIDYFKQIVCRNVAPKDLFQPVIA